MGKKKNRNFIYLLAFLILAGILVAAGLFTAAFLVATWTLAEAGFLWFDAADIVLDLDVVLVTGLVALAGDVFLAGAFVTLVAGLTAGLAVTVFGAFGLAIFSRSSLA